jgi:hypothetical protein
LLGRCVAVPATPDAVEDRSADPKVGVSSEWDTSRRIEGGAGRNQAEQPGCPQIVKLEYSRQLSRYPPRRSVHQSQNLRCDQFRSAFHVQIVAVRNYFLTICIEDFQTKVGGWVPTYSSPTHPPGKRISDALSKLSIYKKISPELQFQNPGIAVPRPRNCTSGVDAPDPGTLLPGSETPKQIKLHFALLTTSQGNCSIRAVQPDKPMTITEAARLMVTGTAEERSIAAAVLRSATPPEKRRGGRPRVIPHVTGRFCTCRDCSLERKIKSSRPK